MNIEKNINYACLLFILLSFCIGFTKHCNSTNFKDLLAKEGFSYPSDFQTNATFVKEHGKFSSGKIDSDNRKRDILFALLASSSKYMPTVLAICSKTSNSESDNQSENPQIVSCSLSEFLKYPWRTRYSPTKPDIKTNTTMLLHEIIKGGIFHESTRALINYSGTIELSTKPYLRPVTTSPQWVQIAFPGR